MISNALFSEVISHILHPLWPLVEWKLLIDTKVLLLRSEIHFTYHNEERATHSQVATTSIRRFPSQSKLTIDPKLLSACITLKYLSGNFLTLQVYLEFSLALSDSIPKAHVFFYTRCSSENYIHRYPST